MHGRVLALALAALALTAVPARATVPTGNLVVNPGAEADVGATGSGTAVPTGWTPGIGSLSADVYDQANVPPAPPDGGVNFFFGGHDAESTLTQTIDVSEAAAEIDTGQVTLTLSALLGGFSSQEDAMAISVRYLDASGGVLGSVAIGPVTATDRNSTTVFVARAATAPVAPQTRALSVLLDAIRVSGADNDGSADNVSVSLSAPAVQPTASPTPTPTPTPQPTPTPSPQPTFHQDVVVQPSGTVKVRKPGSNTFVTVTAAAEIPLGSTVDTRHGAVVLSSVPKPGAAPQSANFYDGIFRVTQPGGITQLALTQPLAPCRGASAAAKKPRTRKLWGDGTGAFRTQGQYSSATVRGTKWLVQDSCAGTLTRVARGVVSVRDDIRHRTLVLRSGKKYLARPRHR